MALLIVYVFTFYIDSLINILYSFAVAIHVNVKIEEKNLNKQC